MNLSASPKSALHSLFVGHILLLCVPLHDVLQILPDYTACLHHQLHGLAGVHTTEQQRMACMAL